MKDKITYYSNGKIQKQISFSVADFKISKKVWDEKGTLLYSIKYDNGEKTVKTYYYPNNNIKRTVNYTKGYKHGNEQYFDEQEHLTRTIEWDFGRIESDTVYYKDSKYKVIKHSKNSRNEFKVTKYKHANLDKAIKYGTECIYWKTEPSFNNAELTTKRVYKKGKIAEVYYTDNDYEVTFKYKKKNSD